MEKGNENIPIGIGSLEESNLVEELCALHPQEMLENPRLVKFMAECSLRNRFHDRDSSSKRLCKYLAWRRESFGDLSDHSVMNNPTLNDQIRAGLLFISPIRLPDGSALMFIRMRKHDPTIFSAKQSLYYWHYMIMTALVKDPALARHGFVMINNFEGAGLANVDLSVPSLISNALDKCMPIRVNSINAVNPPWVIKFVFPVVKALLSSKLGERLNIIPDAANLSETLSIPVSSLPAELGGEVEVGLPEDVLKKITDDNLII